METRPFTVRDVINGIRRRLVLVLLVFLAILSVVGVVTLTAEKTYESKAKLFVRLGRENIGLDPMTTLGEQPVVSTPMSREAEIISIVHMIRSHNLYTRVVESIGADVILSGQLSNPGSENENSGGSSSFLNSLKTSLTDVGVLNKLSSEERAVIKLAKNLSVSALDRSNVIEVAYETESPELAQRVVRELINSYLDWHVKMNRTPGALELLNQQTAKIASDLRDSEKKLERFKIETGMLSADLQKQKLVERIAALRDQLLDAKVKTTVLESEVVEMQSRFLELSETHIVSKTVGTGNDSVDGMRQQLYRQEIELETLLGKHTAAHPAVVALQKTIDEAKSILVEDQVGQIESVLGSNPVYHAIQIELIKKQPLLIATRAKAKLLEAELSQVIETLAQFSRNENRYVVLTRELEVQNDKYRRSMRSLAQARVDESLEKNKLSNISISQPASLSQKPVRPNKLINLVLGILFGLCGSLGMAVSLEYLKSGSRSTSDIESALGTPVIVSVPQVSRQQGTVLSGDQS